MKKLLATLALLALPFLANAQQVLYGATGGNTASNLYQVDTATGATTIIGPIGNGVTGMSLNPITNVMYGVTSNAPTCPRCLVTINLTTGLSTPVGAGLGLNISEIEFRSDGTLFGWSESSDDLAVINTTTGVATTVADSGLNTFGDGMVFSGGTLFVMPEGDTGNIYSVNTTTGLPTLVAALTGSPSGGAGYPVSAATVQPGTGTVFAGIQNFGAAPAFLVKVNLATGAITNVGNTVLGIDALAFGPAAGPAPGPMQVPTMSSWALALMALLMLGTAVLLMRRKARR